MTGRAGRPVRRPRFSTVALVSLLAGAQLRCEGRGGSSDPPDDPYPHRTPTASDLPNRYVLVGDAGATAFDRLPTSSAATQGAAGGSRVDPGFGFAVMEERIVSSGRRYVRISDGRWLAGDGVAPARPSTFKGTPVPPGDLDQPGGPLRLGWVVAPLGSVRAAAAAQARLVAVRPRHARLTFTGTCREGWCPLHVGWIRAVDVAIPTRQARPGRVGPLDRWLDIDISSQTLVAYQGDQPVYATLVSTGIGADDSPLATPTGVFTIHSKRQLVRMDNLEHTGVTPYAYDVPLAQYFTPSKALHAALWHDHFGRPSSHGCVNAAPEDARWLYDFTLPVVSRGATAADAKFHGAGTVVLVRGQLPALSPN